MNKFKILAWVLTIIIVVFQIFWIQKVYDDTKENIVREINNKFEATLLELNYKMVSQSLKEDSTYASLLKIMNLPDTTNLMPNPNKNEVKVYKTDISDSLIYPQTINSNINININLEDSVFINIVSDTFVKTVSRFSYFTYHLELFDNADAAEIHKASISTAYKDFNIPMSSSIIRLYYKGIPMQVFSSIYPYIIMAIIFSILCISAIYFFIKSLHRSNQLLKFKSDFTRNMTHELKTPLSTINAALETMSYSTILDDKELTQEYVQIMQSEVGRLNNGIDLILTYSQLENNTLSLDIKKLDLEVMLRQIKNSTKYNLNKVNGILNINNSLLYIYADEYHLSNVIINLIDNSIKYVKHKPVINLEFKEHQNEIEIVYTDNGEGIPEEFHKDIFKPYFRIPEDNLHTVKGYGLGLAYVKGVVNLHKGEIKMSKHPNYGIYYSILLPKIISNESV